MRSLLNVPAEVVSANINAAVAKAASGCLSAVLCTVFT